MVRSVRKSKAPGRRARKMRVRKSRTMNVPDKASLSETRTIISPGNNLVNVMYNLMNVQLDQFTRASLVAQAYQHYRIKHISLKFKPAYDSFVSGATVAFSKPYFYSMIDKAGAIPTGITLEGLKQMGAKPRAFDEKPIVIGWRPSVLANVMTTSGPAPVSQGSAYKVSPWLNTNDTSVDTAWQPSTVDHLGIYWTVEAAAAGSPAQFAYEIDCEVQFEFKKPLITRSTGRPAVAATFATINDSYDGVVGGPDGV